MKDIKISILATYYNIVEYVDEGIQSILDQECDFEYEVVFGDDGSTDGTREKLEEWCRRYPDKMSLHVMERDPEKKYLGPVRASRNRLNLLQYVNGKYFLYFDGDDYYTDRKKLQKQFDILEQHPEYMACGHKIVLLNSETGERKDIPSDTDTYTKNVEQYWCGDYLHTDTILFRSSEIEKLDHSVLRDVFNDNRITYALLQGGYVHYIPDAMAVYRWTGTGIYTESSRLVKQLREMITFETALRINKKNWKSSCCRFYTVLKFFADYKCTTTEGINEDSLALWKKMIEENGFKFVQNCYEVIMGAEVSREIVKYKNVGFVYLGKYRLSRLAKRFGGYSK